MDVLVIIIILLFVFLYVYGLITQIMNKTRSVKNNDHKLVKSSDRSIFSSIKANDTPSKVLTDEEILDIIYNDDINEDRMFFISRLYIEGFDTDSERIAYYRKNDNSKDLDKNDIIRVIEMAERYYYTHLPSNDTKINQDMIAEMKELIGLRDLIVMQELDALPTPSPNINIMVLEEKKYRLLKIIVEGYIGEGSDGNDDSSYIKHQLNMRSLYKCYFSTGINNLLIDLSNLNYTNGNSIESVFWLYKLECINIKVAFVISKYSKLDISTLINISNKKKDQLRIFESSDLALKYLFHDT